MKKRTLLAFVILALLIPATTLLSGCNLPGLPGGSGGSAGTVTGKVYQQGTTNPLPGVTVAIAGKQAVTDAFGLYSIADVPGGRQDVTATTQGYDPFAGQVNVSGNTTFDIRLSTNAPPVVIDAVHAPELAALNGRSGSETTATLIGNVYRLMGQSVSVSAGYALVNGREYMLSWDTSGDFSQPVPLNQGPNAIQLRFRVGDYFSTSGIITVTVTLPRVDIRAVLSWDTDVTDVDMHMFNRTPGPPDADDWWATSGHVSWMNAAPSDWGSGAAQNPVLDIDDTDGFGPETIVLQEAAPGRYHLYVHYYDAYGGSGLTASTATIRLWLFSGTPNQVYREFSKRLTSDWEYWYVATIDMPSGTVTVPAAPASMLAPARGTALSSGGVKAPWLAKKHL